MVLCFSGVSSLEPQALIRLVSLMCLCETGPWPGRHGLRLMGGEGALLETGHRHPSWITKQFINWCGNTQEATCANKSTHSHTLVQRHIPLLVNTLPGIKAAKAGRRED